MIVQSFGASPVEALMVGHGLGSAFQARQERLADFMPGFGDNLPGFARHILGYISRRSTTRQKGAADEDDRLHAAAARIRETASDVLLFGTGGSSLGAQAALAAGRYGGQSGPLLHTPDSLDPWEMNRLLESLNPRTTHVLAISKSGSTAETLAQLLVTRSWLEQAVDAERLGTHFTFVTEPGERPLRRYGEQLGSPILDHPTDIGGRYSVLTVVGMLPMAVRGLSVAQFRNGAAALLDTVMTNPATSIPYVGASFINALADARGMTETLLMAYADCLRPFTRWHGQLWAESLGKDGRGITPLRAIGPVDQHSQLQLFLDGPNNRSITLMVLPGFGQGPRIDAAQARSLGLDYMADKTIGDTVTCQARATGNALRRRGRLVRELTLVALDEATLGALFMSFMLETVFSAVLLGVNAFDQPAVEDGKLLTRRYLADL